MSSRPIVIAGATGFVGSHLAARLRRAGHSLRLGSRRPEAAAENAPEYDWVHLDVGDPESLEAALEGASALVYLVHGMRHHTDDLVAREEACALRVRTLAEAAGVDKIVYLGGPRPQGRPSVHLQARLRTGAVLRGGDIDAIELRAGMIVGAGSESWVIVRDLARRLPVMVLPSWLGTRSQPVALADVLAALQASLERELSPGVYDIPGPEVLTARQILERVAALSGTSPLMLPIPWLSPSLSSHWIRWVTRADHEVARQLVDGLTSDLVAPNDGIWRACPDLARTPLDEAMRQALADEPPLPLFGRVWERTARRVALRVAGRR